MEYGNSLQDLEKRGYDIEERPDGTVLRVTNKNGEELEDPTAEELTKLTTGMTIASIKKERSKV